MGGQVGDLARRLLLMEESSVKSEERLAISATNLAKTSIEADQSIKDQQTLEVSEEKSLEREDVLQKQIKELMAKLKLADTRSENAEMDIGRLNVRIDKVEEDLVTEKSKIKQVSDDLNAVFTDLEQGVC